MIKHPSTSASDGLISDACGGSEHSYRTIPLQERVLRVEQARANYYKAGNPISYGTELHVRQTFTNPMSVTRQPGNVNFRASTTDMLCVDSSPARDEHNRIQHNTADKRRLDARRVLLRSWLTHQRRDACAEDQIAKPTCLQRDF